MSNRKTGSHLTTWIFTFCALLLVSASAQAKSKLKPGATCELQKKITVRNKAQRKNVKTRQLAPGTTFKILRYHRVWVRIETADGVAFATPKSIRRHCQEAAAKPKTADAPSSESGATEPPPMEGKTEAAPVPVPKPTAPAADTTQVLTAPAGSTTATIEPAPKTPPQEVQPAESRSQPVPVMVPNLLPTTERRVTEISPAAWVALSAGAIGMGTSAYFVSQLTTQDEATTGQVALLTGATGIIAIVIGLSYILSPNEVVSSPSTSASDAISAGISVGPGSITVSGQF